MRWEHFLSTLGNVKNIHKMWNMSARWFEKSPRITLLIFTHLIPRRRQEFFSFNTPNSLLKCHRNQNCLFLLSVAKNFSVNINIESFIQIVCTNCWQSWPVRNCFRIQFMTLLVSAGSRFLLIYQIYPHPASPWHSHLPHLIISGYRRSAPW